jgi:WD40 repeat protein
VAWPRSNIAQLPEPVRLGQPVKPSVFPEQHRTSIAFSPDGKKLAWVYHTSDKAANDGGGLMVYLWDLEKKYALSDMKAASDFTYARSPLRFLPNGRMLLLGCFQLTTEQEELAKPATLVRNNVRVWLAASGKELPFTQRADAHMNEVWEAVAVSPDAKVVIAAANKEIRVWNFPDGKEQRRFSLLPTTRWVLSTDSKLAAGATADETIHVWNTDDGKEMASFPGGGRALGFSPDNKYVAAIQGELLSLWEIQGGKLVWSVPGKLGKDEDQGSRFNFAANGQRLAWNEDGKITVADSATGKTTVTIKGEPGPVVLSPDGKRLALACVDGTALLWELNR